MSCNIFPHAYDRLIKENTDWLYGATKHIKHALERDHIIAIMNDSAKNYRDYGYTHAMNGNSKQLAKPADGWISVNETMPEGFCLAYYKNDLNNGRTVKAKYTTKFTEEANGDDDWTEYNEADDNYYYPEGWYECIDNWGDFSFVTINHIVTHWQPLPNPPINELTTETSEK
jgi:hypothetical protein